MFGYSAFVIVFDLCLCLVVVSVGVLVLICWALIVLLF